MRGCVSSAAVAALAVFTASTEASRLTPPVLPLIVRNPYLSTWLQDARAPPWGSWPMFWTGQEVGLSVLVSVPENRNVYPLLGKPHDSLLRGGSDGYNVSFPVYMDAKYDASTTNLTYFIPSEKEPSQGTDIVISFLSPITPTSTLRQSIPASYVSIHVTGHSHVSVYIDLNGQWVSGDRASHITWNIQTRTLPDGKALRTWYVSKQDQQVFEEYQDRAEWGTLHFTGPSDVQYEAGTSAILRQQFSKTGTLTNRVDDRFRGIMDKEPVFAFAKSFNLNASATSSKPTSGSVLFTIAHTQDPVVQYAAARGLTFMRPLWKAWFTYPQDLLTFHYLDYRNALTLAANYSAQLAADAFKSGAEDYVDIVALSARQVLGATSFSGTPENPILFLKEISSNGNFQTVDVIFPAFPFFLYTNPRWLAYLLEPLIEHMQSGQYPNKYTMHDLGTHFPNATGHPDGHDEYMPLEECGNILVMGLALVNSLKYDTEAAAGSLWSSSGSDHFDESPESSAFALTNLGQEGDVPFLDDRWGGSAKGIRQARKWTDRSYPMWKQWTGYLEEFALRPHNQLSTDDFAGWLALQSNLALKGIIGIKAMSELAAGVGQTVDSEYYANVSRTYISKWEEYAISRDGTHAKLAYDWYGSWTMLYNLFNDALLCFHMDSSSVSSPSRDQKPLKPGHGDNTTKGSSGFVPKHVYKMQSDWYATVRQRYGVPLDSRHLYTKTDWEFFASAVTGPKTRSQIVQSVALWINETSTDRPLTDLHDTEGTGGFPGVNFFARPVVGGHFAFLALGRACDGRAMEGLAFLDDGEDILYRSAGGIGERVEQVADEL